MNDGGIYMKIKKYIKALVKMMYDSDYRFLILSGLGFYDKLDDESYLKRKYKACIKKDLNIDNPRTFNEKLQWLKLHDRKPEYTMMVDKYAVRQYIADTIGEEYLIPLLGIWDNPDDIDFDSLPNQFVLKCNHNSGLGMCICKDKSKLNIGKVKAELRKGLRQDYYLTGREWPYKNVPRRIVCEKYMQNANDEDLTDYKFFCFNGEPKIMYIACDHAKQPKPDFFDMNFDKINMRMEDPNSEEIHEKPKYFEEMKLIARKLSSNTCFLRVDFYVINNKLYFGELTFFHMSGFAPVNPEEWSYKLGDWIKLPE